MSDDNPLKRKHVAFDGELNEPNESRGLPMQEEAFQAADFTAAVEEPVKRSKASKVKTEAQKRYLKKKLTKRKVITAARKRSTPKTKAAQQGEAEDGEKEHSEDPADQLPAMEVDEPSTEVAAAVDEVEGESKEARKARRRLEKEAKKAPKVNDIDMDAPGEGIMNENQKELLKKAQKAMKAAKKPTKVIKISDDRAPSVASSSRSRSGSPLVPAGTLPSFPLPVGPAKPDAALLSAQGLPSALKDAVLIDEGLRTRIDDLLVQRSRKGKEKEMEGLDETLKKKLREAGVEEFFAVQSVLLPELLKLELVPGSNEFLHDYLISAPTGSGKTLSYAIPLVQMLSHRVVTRLRALIILPTRDLVTQVRETLELLTRGTGLKIGTATGQNSFAQEQTALVKDLDKPLLGGSSKIDILIATPGRLMEHLQGTPNFSLQHLRFLIVDEADRLLTQSFQDWLAQVLVHLRPPKLESTVELAAGDAIAASWYEDLQMGGNLWEGSVPLQSTCQKLLFSATLTRDPSKIAALNLRNPKYFIVRSGNASGDATPASIVGQEFTIPSSLTEKMIILPPELKPLNLLHLLHSPVYKITQALCFTKSLDSANRLLKLIEFFEDAFVSGGGKKLIVKGYSGELSSAERGRLIGDFKKGLIDVLVSSDLISRGIDLPTVSHVISYDIPIDMRKYVHRVGRTARAGRDGVAWSLVEKQEARHFKEMLATSNHLKDIKKVKIKETDLESLKESYGIAMTRFKRYFDKSV